MAAPTKEYDKRLEIRLKDYQRKQAEAKAKRLGYATVSDMIRAFIDGDIKTAA